MRFISKYINFPLLATDFVGCGKREAFSTAKYGKAVRLFRAYCGKAVRLFHDTKQCGKCGKDKDVK